MYQSGSILHRWVTLQDLDSTGSKLYGGSLIYGFGGKVSISGKVNFGYNNKTMQDNDNLITLPGSTWNSQIANNSYTGGENHIIRIDGTWTTDLVAEAGEVILSPYKIFVLAQSGKTLRLKNERTIRNFTDESPNLDLYVQGMPVVILDYAFDESPNKEGVVYWSMTLREDKV